MEPVILSNSEGSQHWFSTTTGMLRSAQHDKIDFFSNLLDVGKGPKPGNALAVPARCRRYCRLVPRRYARQDSGVAVFVYVDILMAEFVDGGGFRPEKIQNLGLGELLSGVVDPFPSILKLGAMVRRCA
ncbi:MAG: hypothetical protein ACRD22_20810, partial [Terriglobia bacterium]